MSTQQQQQKILFIGATGYIGGTVLSRLLAEPKSPGNITALVRDASKASKLQSQFGVNVVMGETANAELLRRLAADADVIFSIAESDNVASAKALLAGCKRRFDETGRATVYIHTSGVGAIADLTTMGMHGDSQTWDDTDDAQIATISPDQLHHAVDLELLAADDEGYIRSYIVLPSTVFGIAKTPLVDAGIQNPHTTLLTHFVPPAIARGQGGFIGEGNNIWGNVEVHELADLFLLIFTSHSTASHGRTGLYFASNDSHTLRAVADTIAQTIHASSKFPSSRPTATPFSEEDIEKYFPMPILTALIASNAKTVSSRARMIGWKPVKTTEDFLQCTREVTANYIRSGKAA
ncbi:NmrA domain-containing protein [Mycena kentingensis (nom. inval.)]|nr:NmrA domain-containing protein [Mycena kentingensis (nom. inval.)]